MIRPLDRERLRQEFNSAQPFRFFVVDNFLDDGVAQRVFDSYPSFDEALKAGRQFKAVNELRKVQITERTKFSPIVDELGQAIQSPQFLADLSYITGINNLLGDNEFEGGGMHLTGPGGRLDVHVDFNYIEGRKMHRRLNLLLYLNPVWEDAWGGHIELWDRDVKNRAHRYLPVANRCLIFETSNISFHGVAPITEQGAVRRSFAAYFYTKEAPPHWQGVPHSTIFKARPDERFRGYVLMPLEKVRSFAHQRIRGTAKKVKDWVFGGRA
jgi:Rps23 Pro-64 3,4-dihydroxylase Tpa1-like proline 4-hydroxylase